MTRDLYATLMKRAFAQCDPGLSEDAKIKVAADYVKAVEGVKTKLASLDAEEARIRGEIERKLVVVNLDRQSVRSACDHIWERHHGPNRGDSYVECLVCGKTQ